MDIYTRYASDAWIFTLGTQAMRGYSNYIRQRFMNVQTSYASGAWTFTKGTQAIHG